MKPSLKNIFTTYSRNFDQTVRSSCWDRNRPRAEGVILLLVVKKQLLKLLCVSLFFSCQWVRHMEGRKRRDPWCMLPSVIVCTSTRWCQSKTLSTNGLPTCLWRESKHTSLVGQIHQVLQTKPQNWLFVQQHPQYHFYLLMKTKTKLQNKWVGRPLSEVVLPTWQMLGKHCGHGEKKPTLIVGSRRDVNITPLCHRHILCWPELYEPYEGITKHLPFEQTIDFFF